MDIDSNPSTRSAPGRAVEPSPRGRFFRHPPFWVGLSLLAAVAVVFAVRFFPAAFPVVGLELAMDRESALEAAWELATEHGWISEDHRQAASFREPNREARTYLELELGIDDAFSHLVEVADFHPYRWQVRHFREGERTEATVRFTPDGSPYGFTLELPEDEPGAALSPDEARRLAEANVEVWGVGLERF